MGNHMLRDCVLSFGAVSFDEDRRSTGPLAFAIVLSKWRPWEMVPDNRRPRQWMVAERRAWNAAYYDYCDLLALDVNGRFWHRRLDPCFSSETEWSALPRNTGDPSFDGAFSALAISVWPKNLMFIAARGGALFSTWLDGSGQWAKWAKLEPWVYPVNIFGLPDTSAAPIPVSPATESTVFAGFTSQPSDGIELHFVGADGHIYAHLDWRPGDSGPWRKIEVNGFTVSTGADYQIAGDRLFALATTGALWSSPANRTILQLSPQWEVVSFPGLSIRRFSVAIDAETCHVLVTASDGSVWAAVVQGQAPIWTPLGQPGGSPVPPEARVVSAIPYTGRLDIFVVSADGLTYTATWDRAVGWSAWRFPVNGAQGFAAATHSPAIVHRVNRQVELFVQSQDGEIFRTWWS